MPSHSATIYASKDLMLFLTKELTDVINAIVEKQIGMDFYPEETRDILRLGDALNKFTDGRVKVVSTSSTVGTPATSKTVDRFFSAKDRGLRRIA